MPGPSETKYCKDGWFHEKEQMWPGQAMALKVVEIMVDTNSKFQEVFMFKSETYGMVLVLDGCIQVTERDEFAYHEMMAMLTIMSHPNPKNILIVGGGDGGIIRELAKDAGIERIDICELDQMVIDVSKQYLPKVSVGYQDPRVNVYVQDGIQFMGTKQGQYDIIITDSSDPVGPAEVLFEESYFVKMRDALRPGGIIASQGESFWLSLSLIKEVKTFCQRVFQSVRYASITIPTYPCGQMGFIMCRKEADLGTAPVRALPEAITKDFKYYNAEVHKAAFVLPNFAAKELM